MHKNKRCPFSEKENQVIIDSIKEYGEDWDRIAKRLLNRTPKQCHDRYNNYLRDGLKKEPWTDEEDNVLLGLYKEYGPKWTKMTGHIPGRSGNDIKNRWHKHLCKYTNQTYQLENQNSNAFSNVSYDNTPLEQYPYNYQFYGQLYPYNVVPMVQMVPQTILPYQYYNYNDNQILQESKPKKSSNAPKKQKSKNKINKETKKINENETQTKKTDKNDKLNVHDQNQKSDIFSSINFPDVDVEDFFDGINIPNVDFYSLI